VIAPLAAAAGALAAACLVAMASARGLARLKERLPLLDRPGPRKPQAAPVATVGGVALAAGFAAGSWVASAVAPSGAWGGGTEPGAAAAGSGGGSAAGTAAIAALCFLVGLADDLGGKKLHAAAKAAATLAALLAPHLLDGPAEARGWLLLLPFAFVALHAMNTIDHANGLAGLVALAGALAFAAVELSSAGTASGRPPGLGRHALLLAAALAGFLFLNFPRARVFLGDSGTLLLGGCLAGLLLERRRPELLLLAAVPIADLVSVALLRARAGAKPWVGDRRHVTHRLAQRGIGEAKAVLLLAALQAGCSLVAGLLLARRAGEAAAWSVTIGVIGALAAGMLFVRPYGARPARPS
jgi:UDP-GlcNAc:undecaprenyl-phosphate GlcNAc-1-phosphate transferase